MTCLAAFAQDCPTGETAIVGDLEQTGPGGVKGQYYDAYADGRLLCAFDTAAEAHAAIRRSAQ
jgi:hypothetical protein